MKLHIVTLTNKHYDTNSHEHRHLDLLKKNFEPHVFLHIINNYNTNIKNLSKIFITYQYILECQEINENDIICIIDGHDVIFNSKNHSTKELAKQFVETGSDIVFSIENNCAHHSDITKLFFESLSKTAYLNSGVIIAYKKKYIEMFADIIHKFDELSTPGNYSDQRVIGNYLSYYMHQSKNLRILFDYENTFALTVNTNTEIPNKINAYFIHITFIAKQSQYEKYKKIIETYI